MKIHNWEKLDTKMVVVRGAEFYIGNSKEEKGKYYFSLYDGLHTRNSEVFNVMLYFDKKEQGKIRIDIKELLTSYTKPISRFNISTPVLFLTQLENILQTETLSVSLCNLIAKVQENERNRNTLKPAKMGGVFGHPPSNGVIV